MLQAVPEQLELIQPLNGSTPFIYTTSDTLDQVMGNNYFLTVGGNLRRGDTIRVFRDTDRHMQVWDLIVVESGHKRVAVDLIGKIYDSGQAARAHPQQKRLENQTAPAGCSVKRTFGGFAVIDAEGREICRVSTKAKAEAIAGGQVPIPSQQAMPEKKAS